MGTISAKKLEESLANARDVGLVEEKFTIGDCEVTLRNLRPDEYEAALTECRELDDLRYLNEFQMSHVCRSIQELNGLSLREVDFIECEESDPKKPGQIKAVKREKHQWLRDNVVKTWSKEAIYTAYRKFSDVVSQAETKAKEGISFLTPDETDEERFRRLVNELKSLESEVPPALVTAILQESGYDRYTAPQDRQALNKLDDLSEETTPPPEGTETPAAAPPPPASPVKAADILRRRVPLNQQSEDLAPPVQQVAPLPVAIAPVPTAPVPTMMSKRSAEFLAQEAEFDPDIRAVIPTGVIPPGVATHGAGVGAVAPEFARHGSQIERAEVRPQQEHSDPNQLAGIVERPPAVGLNPKFRPPQR